MNGKFNLDFVPSDGRKWRTCLDSTTLQEIVANAYAHSSDYTRHLEFIVWFPSHRIEMLTDDKDDTTTSNLVHSRHPLYRGGIHTPSPSLLPSPTNRDTSTPLDSHLVTYHTTYGYLPTVTPGTPLSMPRPSTDTNAPSMVTSSLEKVSSRDTNDGVGVQNFFLEDQVPTEAMFQKWKLDV